MSDGIELTDDEYDTFMAVLAEQRCQHSHADTACPPPPERAILTDLIAELRACPVLPTTRGAPTATTATNPTEQPPGNGYATSTTQKCRTPRLTSATRRCPSH